jgi:type II secretory pathway pseudopilin PulG
MAVLLVGIAVMSIMLSVAMPVWHQQMQREKEAELIFRGEQYAHAIVLFQHKYGAALPPNVQVLLDQNFLRKKYLDPMTGKDFQPVYQATNLQPGTQSGTTTTPTPGAATPPASGAGPTTPAPPPASAGASGPGGTTAGVSGPQGGLIGVVSTSKAQSIRIYNGFDHYDQWAFLYTQFQQQGSPGGVQRPGQPGQPGQVNPSGQPGQTVTPGITPPSSPGSSQPGR